MSSKVTKEINNLDKSQLLIVAKKLGINKLSRKNKPELRQAIIENIKVISSYIVGNNHIKSILLGKDGSKFKSFAWGAKNSPLEALLNSNNKKRINIAGKMRLNEWKGKKDVEFMIEDISLN